MKPITTAKEFGEVMRVIGGYLDEKDRAVMAGMAWALVPFDQRRAVPLEQARPYRFRGLPWPTAKQCRVPPLTVSQRAVRKARAIKPRTRRG